LPRKGTERKGKRRTKTEGKERDRSLAEPESEGIDIKSKHLIRKKKGDRRMMRRRIGTIPEGRKPT